MQGCGAFRSRVLDYAFPAQWTGSDDSRSVVGYVLLFLLLLLLLFSSSDEAAGFQGLNAVMRGVQ